MKIEANTKLELNHKELKLLKKMVDITHREIQGETSDSSIELIDFIKKLMEEFNWKDGR